MRCMPLLLLLTWTIATLSAQSQSVSSGASSTKATTLPRTRPFHLGFTRWPSDLSLESFMEAQTFAHEHGDIVSVMFIGGIPWPEAVEGKAFSRDVQQNLAYRPPGRTKLFLSISPLDKERKGLAPYWGEKDNLPLHGAWKGYTLNHPLVIQAYTNFILRCVETMKPDYLGIGIELNVLLSHSKAKWEEVKYLHRQTYTAVKATHPALPVFFTTDVMHYKKLASESRGSQQEKEVAELMRYSDICALSFYPHMSYDMPRPTPPGFLDFAGSFGKPVAIAESGMTSRDVELKAFKLTLRGSETEQKQFTEYLLGAASRDHYKFIINFATTDFERLCAKLPPPIDDLARIWAYTGLQTSDSKAKPTLAVWDEYLKLPYASP